MSEWISVKERLPEMNNWILYAVLVEDNKLYKHQIAYYTKSKKWYKEDAQNTPINVTHWLALPKLPNHIFIRIEKSLLTKEE